MNQRPHAKRPRARHTKQKDSRSRAKLFRFAAIGCVLGVLIYFALSFLSPHNNAQTDTSEQSKNQSVQIFEDKPQLDLMPNAAAYSIVSSANADTVYGEKNTQDIISTASLAKLFTIAYILDSHAETEEVSLSQEALSLAPANSSMAYLPAGTYTLKDLIAALLIPSGNDVARALAYTYGAEIDTNAQSPQDKVAAFVDARSEWIKNEGYSSTSLVDPDGFDENNVSSAQDISRLSVFLIDTYPWLLDLSSQASYSIGATKMINTNQLLIPWSSVYDASVQGLKTGSLEHIKNLVVVAHIGEHADVVMTVLGEPSQELRFSEPKAVLDQLHENYARVSAIASTLLFTQ